MAKATVRTTPNIRWLLSKRKHPEATPSLSCALGRIIEISPWISAHLILSLMLGGNLDADAFSQCAKDADLIPYGHSEVSEHHREQQSLVLGNDRLRLFVQHH